MKVGDYVRTNLRNEIVIRKVIDIIHNTTMNDNRMVFDKPTKFTYYVEDNKDYESSQNIIDLIEVGDYVNGCKIIELATNIDGKVLYLETDITEFDNVYACGHINIYEKDIKSIVTKEAFESMEYKVKE